MEVVLDVPYRCPRCGGSHTFNTLGELKSHMAEDHAYSAQRRQRLKIFDYKTPQVSSAVSGRHSPLLQSFLDEGKRLEEEVKTAKKQELSNKLERQKQALSQSRLSLSGVKTNGCNLSLKTSTPRKLKVNFRTPTSKNVEPQDSYLQETVSNLSNEVIVQRHNTWRTADALYSTQDVLSGVEEAAESRVSEQRTVIGRLTQELADKETQIQSLRLELQKVKERDTVSAPQKPAGTHSEDQDGKEQQKLEDDLAQKKSELKNINQQLTKAKQDERQRGHRTDRAESARKLKRKGVRRCSTDQESSAGHVRESHSIDLSSVNTEEEAPSDFSTSQASVPVSPSFGSSAKDRSNTLKKLKQNLISQQSDISSEFSVPHGKKRQLGMRPIRSGEQLQAQRLKAEKHALVEQMKELLTKATTENEKLKGELIAKENQLKILNQHLEKTKNDQTELMEETFDLYKEAEKSLGKLKDMLKVKEAQLEQANVRVEEIRGEQEKLAAERQNMAQHVTNKDSLYHNMLQEREEQIQRLNQLLASQQEERDRLTEMASELKKEVQEKEKSQQDLSKAVTDKEQELTKAKEDVEALSTFLQTAAAKESVARGKLEAFVTELIDRADRAERELRVLRGLESTSSGNLTSDLSQSHSFPQNISAIPDESATGYTSMPPHSPARQTHSTPLKQHVRSPPTQADARQILQTSLEPWYNNLGASPTDVPVKPPRSDFQATDPSVLNHLGDGVGDSVNDALYPYPPHPPPQPHTSHLQSGLPLRPQDRISYSGSNSPRLHPYQEVQPLPISESSEEFAPLPSRHQARFQINHHLHPQYNNCGFHPEYDGHGMHPGHGDHERVDSHLYASAASPQRIRGASNLNQNNAGSLDYPALDPGQASPERQEFSYTDSSSAYPPIAPQSGRQNVKTRGNASHSRTEPLPPGVKPLPSSHKKRMTASAEAEISRRHILGDSYQTPDKPKKAALNRKGTYHDSLDSTDTLDGAKGILPDRTYTIFSIVGEEAKKSYFEQHIPCSDDSENSGHRTPRSNVLSSESRPRLKGKMRPSSAPQTQMRQARGMYTPEESSLDGLELSIDDNGIMWEAANSCSDISESYRMSPYGSETAGDVDSSVLLSSHSITNQGILKAQDTDEDVEVFDDADFLQATSIGDDLKASSASKSKGVQDKSMSRLPLGERISRILKCVGVDDDHSEQHKLRDRSGKRQNGKGVVPTEKNLQPEHDTETDAKPDRVSPLERALSVQNRVKSLTFPREKKKSVTISDTSTSELADKPGVSLRDQRDRIPVCKPRRKTESFRGSSNRRVEFEPPEDFSSSSYASMSMPAPVRRAHSPTPIPQLPDKPLSGIVAAFSPGIGPVARYDHEDRGKQSEIAQPVPAKRQGIKVNVLYENSGAESLLPVTQSVAEPESKQNEQYTVAKSECVTSAVPISAKHGVSTSAPSQVPHQNLPVEKMMEQDLKQPNRHQVIKASTQQKFPSNDITALLEKELQSTESAATHLQTSQLAAEYVPQHSCFGGVHSDVHREVLEPRNESQHEEIALVTEQPSAVAFSALQRQASVTTDDSSDVKRYQNVALVPAKQLRARFSQASHSSLQSSTDSLSSPRAESPPLLHSSSPQDKGGQDSTDFELESDLEKLAAPGAGAGTGGLRRGLVMGKPGGRKVIKKTQTKKNAVASRNSGQRSAPDITDESSVALSDVDMPGRSLREERRRRRVALFHIFSYLDTQTLSRMALVCKEWQRVSRHPALWKRVHLKYDRISSQYLITISKWCTQLTSLTLEGLRPGSRKSSETMDEYQRRTRGSLESGLEELLKVSQNSLTSLSIIACGNILTEKCMWLVSGYCRLLQRLTYMSDTHPLTAEVMWALGGGCPSITSLFIPPLFPRTNIEGMTNRCLLLLAQFYPDLKEVGVGGRALDITGLVPLVQSCQRLHLLSLDHIKELGDDAATALCRAGLRQLQKLEISGTPLTANAIKTFYSSCRHLKEIRIVISISDMFDDARKKKNKEQYKKVIHSLEELKSQAGLGNVLYLQAAPVE